jgi:hypothetical protein
MTFQPFPKTFRAFHGLFASGILLLTACGKPAAGDVSTPPADSLSADTSAAVQPDEADAGSEDQPSAYFLDSLSDPTAWVSEEYLVFKTTYNPKDTLPLQEGEFFKSMQPSLSAVEITGGGSKEIVVTEKIWNSSRGVDVESGDYLYGWEESGIRIEVFDVDAGKRIFHCTPEYHYWSEEVQKDGSTKTDSSYYEYTIKLGSTMEISGVKGVSKPDFEEGRYVWKGTEFVRVKM